MSALRRWRSAATGVLTTLVVMAGSATALAAGPWQSLGTPTNGAGGDVYWVTAPSASTVYAGGAFTAAGGTAAKHVAKWDGTTWSALGSGFGDSVYVLATEPDGTLYAGGNFTQTGDFLTSISKIAKWDGSAWSPLGTGLSGGFAPLVYALAFGPDGSLYAGGRFTSAGGVPVSNIAKWNGTTWSALGSGVNDTVWSLTVASDGTLYAGGDFTTAGGVAANRVAKWNGSSWSALGSGTPGGGTNGTVLSMTTASDGTMYAAGGFSSVDAQSIQGIAKWNGTSWSGLGTGFNATGESVVLASDGTLYAGGQFTAAGGVSASHIAAWDGATWSPLGDGLSGTGTVSVWNLAIAPDGRLYAGGTFTSAGGASANRVAAWQLDQVTGSTTAPPRTAEFTYQLPDGRECGAISPTTVLVGTPVLLPDANADCRTAPDASIAGWTIATPPGYTGSGSPDLPFAPNQGVTVIDSQRFTAVPHEKVLTITYDANVADADPCAPQSPVRTEAVWVPRADFAMARTPRTAVCTPPGHQLIGWNTTGTGAGRTLAPGAPLPEEWATAAANGHRLFAMWR